MKVYFCLNDYGLQELKTRYFDHILVAVHSCVKNTKLQPVLVYDGDITDDIRRIVDLGATLVQHQLSFKEKLREVCKAEGVNFGVAAGAYLRIDIPRIDTESEYSLYADVDVMFLRDPILETIRPRYLGATSERGFSAFGHFNSGVLVLNHESLRAEQDEFVSFILERRLKSSLNDPYDQGNLNDFYRGRWEKIDQTLNWKPYWGFNRFAPIVHWHGVKYPAAKAILEGVEGNLGWSAHKEIFDADPVSYRSYVRLFEDMRDEISRTSLSPFHGEKLNSVKVVGSSHVIRWRKLLTDMGLPNDGFSGTGGCPVWAKSVFTSTLSQKDTLDKVLLIVGDYRFGNGLLANEPEDIFADAPFGISQEFIGPVNDKRMYDRCRHAIDAWAEAFSKKLHILHWTLLGRQVLDRLRGRHIIEGKYSHPTWSLEAELMKPSVAETYDLSILLRNPMHEVMRLFVDEDLHPTFAGYLFMRNLFSANMQVSDAYLFAVEAQEDRLVAATLPGLSICGRKTIVTGVSVWLDTLVRYLGQKGLRRLKKLGVHISPMNGQLGVDKEFLWGQETTIEGADVFVVMSDVSAEAVISKVEAAGVSNWSGLYWESLAAQTIRRRGVVPLFKAEIPKPVPPSLIELAVNDDAVELGVRGEPTIVGLQAVLGTIFSPGKH